MPDRTTALDAAVADLDDGYLQVMLLLAVRRAASEEPRRGALWHALASLLAEEQEERRKGSELGALSGGALEQADLTPGAVEAVLAELRQDVEALESEYHVLVGVPAAGPTGPAAPADQPVGPDVAPAPGSAGRG